MKRASIDTMIAVIATKWSDSIFIGLAAGTISEVVLRGLGVPEELPSQLGAFSSLAGMLLDHASKD